MVLADLGRKITSALRSLSNATIINEEVSVKVSLILETVFMFQDLVLLLLILCDTFCL